MKILNGSNTTNNEIAYENKYGKLKLKTIGAYKNVRSFDLEAVRTEQCLIPIELAEQIALITESRKIQICAELSNLKQFYVVHHRDVSSAALCEIDVIEFKPNEPAKEIIAKKIRRQSSEFSGYSM